VIQGKGGGREKLTAFPAKSCDAEERKEQFDSPPSPKKKKKKASKTSRDFRGKEAGRVVC